MTIKVWAAEAVIKKNCLHAAVHKPIYILDFCCAKSLCVLLCFALTIVNTVVCFCVFAVITVAIHHQKAGLGHAVHNVFDILRSNVLILLNALCVGQHCLEFGLDLFLFNWYYLAFVFLWEYVDNTDDFFRKSCNLTSWFTDASSLPYICLCLKFLFVLSWDCPNKANKCDQAVTVSFL